MQDVQTPGREKEEKGKVDARVSGLILFLLSAGAHVTLVSSFGEIDGEVKEKIRTGHVEHWDRTLTLADVSENKWAFVVYQSSRSDPMFVAELMQLCRKQRIPVNILDSPELSDFSIDLGGKSLPKEGSVPILSLSPQVLTPDSVTPHEVPEALITSTDAFVELSDVTEVVEVPTFVIGIFDGYAVARYVGTGFADVFYDFSVAEEAISHFLRDFDSAKFPTNIYGQNVKVLLMDIRAGAGSALYGTVSEGDAAKQSGYGVRGHAFTPSHGLIDMAPVLHQLAREGVPCVIHSAVAHIGDDLSITPDLSDILSIQYTGVHMVNSTTPQEVHDLAVISHISSQILSAPFVHFFDLTSTARTATTVKLLSRDQLQQLVDSTVASVPVGSGQESKTKRVANVVSAVMAHATGVLGKKYEVFEYTGSSEAEVVIVSVGEASSVVRDTVKALAKNSKVGAIVVHLLRPWDSERFVASIPLTAKKVVVLDSVFSEVVASFHVVSRPIFPSVVNVTNASSFVVTPTVVWDILEHVKSASQLSHISLPVPPRDDNSTLEFPEKLSVTGELWEDPAQDISASIHALLSQTKLNVAASTNIGLLVPESPDHPQVPRVKSSVFQISNDTLTTFDAANPADFLIIYDISLLKKVNVFANLKSFGTLIVQWPFGVQDLEEKLPSATKREIAGKRLKFFVFEASSEHKIASQLAAFCVFSGLLKPTVLKSSKLSHVPKVLQFIGELSQLEAIPTPSAWLDAAENQDLLPPPKPRFIPKKKTHVVNQVNLPQEAVKYLMFPEAFSTSEKLRPDVAGAHRVKVTVNRRLTPASYERNVFHIEFDTTGTSLKYEIGEALAVHGHNDPAEVKSFLQFYGLNPQDLVALPFKGAHPGEVHVKTVEQLFTQYLDLYGRPSKEFYLQLSEFTADPKEKEKLIFLTTPDGQAEYKARVDDTVTFEDVLKDFPSAHPSLEKLLEIIPPIKPRHYSIASSMKMHPHSVHLLVVLVNWENSTKKPRFGHCTRYLSGLVPGDIVTVSVKPSVMTLPPLDSQPIVMAGLGTGMAPFRAFIQERAVLKSQGVEVGPIVLYFGSRSRFAEYLYGEELEAYSRDGLLTRLQLAFSRDQVEKIYIQHKIAEDKSLMWQYLVSQKGHFYLCGPTWPEADVRTALLDSFQQEGCLSREDAEGALEKIRVDERYILELY